MTTGRDVEKHAEQAAGGEPVAVVGSGLVVPGATSPHGLWTLMDEGTPAFTRPDGRWPLSGFHDPDPAAEDRSYADRFGFVAMADEAAEAADGTAADDGTDDRETTRWLRVALGQALRGVRVEPDAGRCGLIVGCTVDGSQRLVEEQALAGVERFVSDEDVLATARHVFARAASGPGRTLPHLVGHDAMRGLLPPDTDVLTLDTACSSALYAVDLGMRRLRAGQADVVVCGATHAVHWREMVLFAKLGGLSRGGDVRALDRAADGVLFSDGAAAVVLKRLADARADGDLVLGVLAGSGVSCDGGGKAINAPNPQGIRLALDRAWADSGLAPRQAAAVIAHATGTPLGDRTELGVLSQTFDGAEALPVVSPKSVIGHTGWTAGLASLVLALGALREGRLPAQPRFTAPPEGACSPALRVPDAPVPLDRGTGTVPALGVSASGFGGTNAHVVVTEERAYPAPAPHAASESSSAAAPSAGPQRPDDPVVLVAWDAYLPGAPDRAAVSAWLGGTGPAPDAAFGAALAPPSFSELRLPKQTVTAMDPAQLIALRAARRLMGQLEGHTAKAERIAVIAGHAGPTRQAVRYSLRCSLGFLRAALPQDSRAQAALDAYADTVAALVPPANEDAYSGLMPNLIAARVAHTLGWRGLNMTVDTGLGATGDALMVAADHLRTGDLDLAVVLGVAANCGPINRRLAATQLGVDAELGEGAFAFALTRASHARRSGLPVLAILPTACAGGRTEADLAAAAVPGRCYLGAETAVALLRLVHRPGAHRIVHHDPRTASRTSWAIDVPEAEPDALPHVTRWTPLRTPATPARSRLLPPDCLTITNASAPLLGASADGVVLNVAGAGWGEAVGSVEQDTVRRILAAHGAPAPAHVRVVLDLAEHAGQAARAAGDRLAEATAAQELALLAFQAMRARTGEGAFGVLLLRAFDHGVPRAETGLFTGFVRAMRAELPEQRAGVLIDEGADAAGALRLLDAQLLHPGTEPVVAHRGDRLSAPRLVPAKTPAREPGPGDVSVVVATGGGRGITAAMLERLAHLTRPRIWILGRSDVWALPEWALADTLDEGAARAAFIRDGLRAGRGPVARLAAEVDGILGARETRATLVRLERVCGADRVRYLCADVCDADQVDRACKEILAQESDVDLLIHGAGVVQGAQLTTRSLPDFRRVRDVKVLGHRHLKRAIGGHVRRWVNAGSVIGRLGGEGTADYAAANAYLSAAATLAAAGGEDERTVSWPPWLETGMAGPLRTGRERVLDGWPHSQLSTRQGTTAFLAELHRTREQPDVTYVAPEDIVPLAAPASRVGQVTIEADDPFLKDHLVAGKPAMAGMALLDIAAGAALRLVPGARLTALENVRFRRLVRLPDGEGAGRLRVHVAHGGRPAGSGTVRVTARLTRDIVRNGVVLVQDLPHCETDVLLSVPARGERDDGANAPEDGAHAWDAAAARRPASDPYHRHGSRVRLSGPFECTSALHLGDGVARASYTPTGQGRTATGALPALLLDATARTGVLAGALDGRPEAQILAGIRRIDLHTPASAASPPPSDRVPLVLSGRRSADGAFDARALTHEGRPVVTLHGISPAPPPPTRPSTEEASSPSTEEEGRTP